MIGKKTVITILMNLITPAYFADQALFALIVLKIVNISLRYGNSDASAFAYGAYGVILIAGLGAFRLGDAFGQLALNLNERFDNHQLKSKIGVLFGISIHPWKYPLSLKQSRLIQAYQDGLNSGDLLYAAYAIRGYIINLYIKGAPLLQVNREIQKYLGLIQQIKEQETTYHLITTAWAIADLVQSSNDQDLPIDIQAMDQKSLLNLQEKGPTVTHRYYISRTQYLYLLEEYEAALEAATKAEQTLEPALATLLVPEHNFYQSLILTALYPTATAQKQRSYWRTLKKNQRRMKKWSDNAPENFAHKYLLVAAEMAGLKGEISNAITLYEQAIDSANKNEFVQNEAIANELAAKYHLGRGQERIAKTYLFDARYSYRQWGATAKVEQLDSSYPQLGTKDGDRTISGLQELQTVSTSTNVGLSVLDLSTIMKASQTISSTIVLDQLLQDLMKIAVENAGAQRGALTLEGENEWLLEAILDKDDVQVRQSLPIDTLDVQGTSLVSTSIINYVIRTRNNVVLSEATADIRFNREPYIIKNQPNSILCMPLINQGKVSGILYLENNLTNDAFTPDRLATLELLSSQMAVALDNATLYKDIKNYQDHLEELVTNRTYDLEIANRTLTNLNNRLQGELTLARHIQQSLLPSSTPNWKNFDLIGYSLPAREVGGDFYTYQAFNEKYISLAIGDISGKGMPAALLMAITISTLQNILQYALNPSTLLYRLDELIERYTQATHQNCALCYLEIYSLDDDSSQNKMMRVANAACIPPLIRHSDGLVEWIDVGGLPLGMGMRDVLGYTEATKLLNSG
ncbi:MAG: GAF domain-containing protein, partial [Chloroflexota bacterium]